ncbi:MAG TPA: ribosome-associated translation inhibitor RaiA [Candidatus Dormibacteraeota bacterium]|nr:ribosome-associated translation inhibitor RaiA [Candidatus Dormibacteraeota bacterium]
MKVVLHDRTDGLGPTLHDYAQRKLTRLARHFGRVAEAEVEFSEERKRSGLSTFVCRINVHLDGRRAPVLSAHERGADAQSALDLALDKIDRQVVKQKEMRTHRKLTASPVRTPMPRERDIERSSEPERIRMKLQPMSVEDAIAELESAGQSFHVFLDEDSGSIQIAFRRSDGSVGVIEPIVV